MSLTEDPLVYARTVLGHALYRAELLGDTEVTALLEPARTLLDDPASAFTVTLRGLCDAGKTTLANALAGAAIIPERVEVPTPCPVRLSSGIPSAGVRLPDGTTEPFDLQRLVGPSATAPPATAIVELTVSPWPLPAGIAVVDAPSDGLDPRTAVGLDREFGGVLLVTDAAQELSDAELDLARSLHAQGALLGVVLTKVDLHVHAERILAADLRHLERSAIDVPVFPVSARLTLLGHATADDTFIAESGTLRLAAVLEQLASNGSIVPRALRATKLAQDATGRMLTEIGELQASLVDRNAQQRNHERLVAASTAIERLRSGQVRWRERLHEGLERLQLDVDHGFRTGLNDLHKSATDELDRGDPNKIWEALSARIQRDADDLLSATRERITNGAETIGQQIATMFGQELTVPLAPGLVHGTAGGWVEQPVAETADRGSVTMAAVRGALPGSSLFTMLLAHFGGVGALGVVAAGAVALPVGLVFGAVSYRMARRGRIEARRRAAQQSIRRFLDGYSPEASKYIRDDLIAVRTALKNHFEEQIIVLQQRVEGEMRRAAEHAELDEAGRRARWSELDEHRQQLELVAAHAEHLLGQLAGGHAP